MPFNTTSGFGGIVDNEIWKTIHLVRLIYKCSFSFGFQVELVLVIPVTYHGMMAFNFSNSSIELEYKFVGFHLFPNLYDLYSVVFT
jgi:hypothetical protein